MFDIISRGKYKDLMEELPFVKECRITRIGNSDRFKIDIIIADEYLKGNKYDSMSWEESSERIRDAVWNTSKEVFKATFMDVFKTTYGMYAEHQ